MQNNHSSFHRKSARMVIAQVLVCFGCCCGKVERGRPEVPVAWLKQEWRRHGLLKRIHLSISGCLGPCDVPNVVAIIHKHGTFWLSGISMQADYEALLNWAVACKEAGCIQELPEDLASHLLESPFLESSPLPQVKQGNTTTQH
jgi:predicted metal-binding protein